QAGAAGHRPALHHPVELEPKVVMQPPRRVLLDNESVAARLGDFAARLRCDVEFALGAVCLERHSALPFVARIRGLLHNARPKPIVPAYYHRSWHARCPGFPHRGPYDCATVARMTRPPDDLPCFGLNYRRNAAVRAIRLCLRPITLRYCFDRILTNASARPSP